VRVLGCCVCPGVGGCGVCPECLDAACVSRVCAAHVGTSRCVWPRQLCAPQVRVWLSNEGAVDAYEVVQVRERERGPGERERKFRRFPATGNIYLSLLVYSLRHGETR
jgi:hypothetical protein